MLGLCAPLALFAIARLFNPQDRWQTTDSDEGTLETFAQFLVNGFALGGVYALLSLGFGVIYNTVRIFHVLHGAVFIAAGYITWVLQEHLGLPLAAAGMLGVVGAMVVGMLIEVGVYRPLRGEVCRIPDCVPWPPWPACSSSRVFWWRQHPPT